MVCAGRRSRPGMDAKFVWEFTPSQGNGTIAAVALTSAQGGQNAYDFQG